MITPVASLAVASGFQLRLPERVMHCLQLVSDDPGAGFRLAQQLRRSEVMDPMVEGALLTVEAICHLWRGELRAVESAAVKVDGLLSESTQPWAVEPRTMTASAAANAAARRGDVARSQEIVGALMAHLRELGDRRLEASLWAPVAENAIRAGRLQEALEACDRAEALRSDDMIGHVAGVRAALSRAMVGLRLAQPELARSGIADARALIAEGGVSAFYSPSLIVEAILELNCGALDSAEALLREAALRGAEHDQKMVVANAEASLSIVLLGQDDGEGAFEALRRAEALGVEDVVILVRIHEQFAALHKNRGEWEETARRLELARAVERSAHQEAAEWAFDRNHLGATVGPGHERPLADLLRRQSLRLEQTSAELRLIAEHSADLICRFDAEGRCLFASRASEQIHHISPEEMIGRYWYDLVHPEDRGRLLAAHAQCFADPNFGPATVEARGLQADGTWRWLEIRSVVIARAGAAGGGTLAIIRDISERRRMLEALRAKSLQDPLTGLPNRVMFDRLARKALEKSLAADRKLAVLFVDLDRFKFVNDSHGHQVGDEVLRELSRRLLKIAGDAEYVARLGGDEFVILVPQLDATAEAEAIAGRVRRELERPVEVNDTTIVTGASVGICIASNRDQSVDDLLRAAHRALYRAKEQGRGRHQVFDDALRVEAESRSDTRRFIQEALTERWLAVHYQPIVDAPTSRLVGVEALLRLVHPEHGTLSPAEFIEVAEDSGLIVQLGAWVIEQVAIDTARLALLADQLEVSVNVSPRQLTVPGFAESVSVIAGGGDPRVRWQFEVTESTLLHADEHVLTALSELRNAGVQFALDDFGTGYSSLTNLRYLPVDVVKIDRSFVHGMLEHTEDDAIVRAILGLSAGLGLRTVAEGVETLAQAEALRGLGCDLLQGYLLGRPQPIEDLERVSAKI